MSSRSYSSHHDPKESNRPSRSKSSSRHRRNLRLEEQNNNYRHSYPPFVIPSSYYNIVHVHRFTPVDIISTLIDHFTSCYRYSIDTESDRFTYQLSLIQVHSIPRHLPSFIVLFELNHFPTLDSLLMGKIKLLFNTLFRLGNLIFSWGLMEKELEFVVRMKLFTWPTPARIVNLQDAFFEWYRRALPPCEACGSIQIPNMAMSMKSSCICRNNFPYVNPDEKWSLQNAICYTVNRFLDKSSTLKNWSLMLDVNYSSLSPSEQRTRIYYAIYDCFAVTFLHQAVYEKWSLSQLRKAELISLFTSNAPPYSSSASSSSLLECISEDENERESIPLPISTAPRYSSSVLLLEDISEDGSAEDDEIFVSSLSSQRVLGGAVLPEKKAGGVILPDTISGSDPSHSVLFQSMLLVENLLDRTINSPQHLVDADNLHDEDIVDVQIIDADNVHEEEAVDVQIPELSQTIPALPKSKSCRSLDARRRRNRRRNLSHSRSRDNHIIIRCLYYRFTLKQVKEILRERHIRYVHIQLDRRQNLLTLGMRNPVLVGQYFDRLPGDLFDREHYRTFSGSSSR